MCEGECVDNEISLGGVILPHILDWEEQASRKCAKKKVIGRCCSTPAPEEAYITTPKIITIKVRMNSDGKEAINDLWKDCEWKNLCDRDGFIDCVWMEEPNFRWDSGLGCGSGDDSRPWIGTLTLVASSM